MKGRKSTVTETKWKHQQEGLSMKNLSIERTIEKDKYCHGFSILGGESEQFMHFTSQRGKYNDPNCAETIKRNFLIINKNVSTIAQFFERQSKWLDQLNA